MLTQIMIATVTVTTVASQLLVKRVVGQLGGIGSFDHLPSFLMAAAKFPSVYASLLLQVGGYVLWMVILSRERLGIAVALSGAFFYLLVTTASWFLLGERLSAVQWAGIVMISAGVICVGVQQT